MHHRGRSRPLTGELVTDPTVVADALRSLLASGTSPRLLGLDVPTGHTITDVDVVSVGRAMIRIQPLEVAGCP